MNETIRLTEEKYEFLVKLAKSGDGLLMGEKLDNLPKEGDEYIFEVSDALSQELNETITLFTDANIENEETLEKDATELMNVLFKKAVEVMSSKLTSAVVAKLHEVAIKVSYSEYDLSSSIEVYFEHNFLTGNLDFTPSAFSYIVSDDFTDTCEGNDWAALLLDEQSPFYDMGSFVEIYKSNQSLLAMDQFVACHAESDLKTELNRKLKELCSEIEDAISDEYDDENAVQI